VPATLAAITTPKAEAVEARAVGVKGRVVDGAGHAVAGAAVTLIAVDDAARRTTDVTDNDGLFRVSLAGAGGDFTLQVEAPGFDLLTSDAHIDDGTAAEVTVQLAAAGATRRRAAIEAYNEGVARWNADDRPAAADRFSEAIELDPTLAPPYLALAQLRRTEGRLPEAAGAIEGYLALTTDDEGLAAAWSVFAALADRDRQSALLRGLPSERPLPALAQAMYKDGATLLQEGDAKRAGERFRRAAELDPDLSPALVALAGLDYREGRLEEASTAVERLLLLDPRHVEGLRLRLLLADVADDLVALAATFERLYAVAPEAAVDLLYRIAERDFRADRRQRAIDHLERLLALRPGYARAHLTLGLAYAADHPARAKDHLRRFLELAPDDPEAATARAALAAL